MSSRTRYFEKLTLTLRQLSSSGVHNLPSSGASVTHGLYIGLLNAAWPWEAINSACGGHTRYFAAVAEHKQAEPELQLTENASSKLQELQRSSDKKLLLRLTVEAGGCSGFSYKFDLDDKLRDTDRVFEANGTVLATDDVSYEFVRGAKVDFSQEMIKSSFEVIDNPNADKGCGCGASFSPKD